MKCKNFTDLIFPTSSTSDGESRPAVVGLCWGEKWCYNSKTLVCINPHFSPTFARPMRCKKASV